MSSLSRKKELKLEKKLRTILHKRGYLGATKIADTLQGTIWRGLKQSTNEKVVIKIISKDLTSKSIIILNGIKHKIYENIINEKNILSYLTNDEKCPNSIVKYIDFMKSNVNYYLIMNDCGHSLFDFNIKVHNYIEGGKINIFEYHKLIKILFIQMIKTIEYIHNKNVCHFDISLENWLINDIDVIYNENTQKLNFCYQQNNNNKNHTSLICTLCDFGIAEIFNENEEKSNDKFLSSKLCGKSCYSSPEISNKYKTFNAQKNDIFCLGVCLFMLCTGNAPFRSTNQNDIHFKTIINKKNGLNILIQEWGKTEYINHQLLQLFNMVLKYENERADIEQIKNCDWLKDV